MKNKRLLYLVIVVFLASATGNDIWAAQLKKEPAKKPLGKGQEEAFLDKIEKQLFSYFWNETNPKNGFIANTTEPGIPASNAACGFMLSSLLIGIERGWITKEQGYQRALTTLKSFKNLENFQGFTYHYFKKNTGEREWTSEVSCIDMGIFLAGAITVGEYFRGTEIEHLANELYLRTNWQWFLDNENVLQMAWTPEKGFFSRINTFSEGILCYIMAFGSATFPIPTNCWDSFLRPISNYKEFELVYVSDGSLFQYLFPLAWLDLRDKHDKYADYWQNAIKAIKANKQYCLDNAYKHKTYQHGFWGLSASLSSDGYKIFGAKPGRNIDNGTVAPYAVAGSIPLVPELAISDYKKMYENNVWALKKYGLTDAFNLDERWSASDYIAIDNGLALLMIENYRSGLIWKYFMQSPYIQQGLNKCGFLAGKQETVTKSADFPGNPNDTVYAPKIKFPVKIDANLKEWKKMPKILLTTKNNRNVEIEQGFVKDDSDCSGVFYLGWDDNYFYVAGRVWDNQIVRQKEKGEIFLDDCVELFFDVNRDGYYFDRNPYDYQFGIAPSYPGNNVQIWSWGYRNRVPEKVKYAAMLLKDGYVIEVAIPFEEINNFHPNIGETIRFSVSIHDRDFDNKAKKLTWSIDSTSQPGKIFFGTLILTSKDRVF